MKGGLSFILRILYSFKFSYDNFEIKNHPFFHGVASGDPTSSSVILWTRVSLSNTTLTDILVQWNVFLGNNDSFPILTGIQKTNATVDYTIKVDVNNLNSSYIYYYSFSVIDKGVVYESERGRTKTLGLNPSLFNIGVVSCSNMAYGYFNSYRELALRDDLDFILHLGDNIYGNGPNGYGDRRLHKDRKPFPPNTLVTLKDYRQRYAQYRNDPQWRFLLRQHPVVFIWDDHEVANNWWQGGSPDHNSTTQGHWMDRKNAGLRAFYEWLPVRDLATAYRKITLGNLAEIYLLDTRSYRSIPSPLKAFPSFGNNVSGTLLGEEQHKWLLDNLRTSKAQWKLIGTSVPMSQLLVNIPIALNTFSDNMVNELGEVGDSWDGYFKDRDDILSHIHDYNVKNVVVLAGDQHRSSASELNRFPFNFWSYDRLTGDGSIAVEFTTPAIASPLVSSSLLVNIVWQTLIKQLNPHVKYNDMIHHGYMTLNGINSSLSVDWWHTSVEFERFYYHRNNNRLCIYNNSSKVYECLH